MQFILTWIWSGIPVWINVQALIVKSDYVWLPVALLSGMAAPFGLWLGGSISSRSWRSIAILGGLLASLYNITNAIGSSAEHRQSNAAPNYELIQQRESMLRRDADLAEKVSKIGWRLNGDTSFSIAARIAQLETTPHYITSDGCLDLRKRDPEKVCFQLSGERGRLAEAKQVETLEAERETIRGALMTIDAPATADVQIATFKTLLGYFVDIKEITISATIACCWALIWELVGTLFPPAVGCYFREENERGMAQAGQLLHPIHSGPLSTRTHNLENSLPSNESNPHPTRTQPAPLDLWLEEGVQRGAGEPLGARIAYHHFFAFCEKQRLDPLPEVAFAAAMQVAGFEKRVIKGRKFYLNLRLKVGSLTIVK